MGDLRNKSIIVVGEVTVTRKLIQAFQFKRQFLSLPQPFTLEEYLTTPDYYNLEPYYTEVKGPRKFSEPTTQYITSNPDPKYVGRMKEVGMHFIHAKSHWQEKPYTKCEAEIRMYDSLNGQLNHYFENFLGLEISQPVFTNH